MAINLSNVQGNILKAFSVKHTNVIFFSITDNEKAKQWLRELSKTLPSSKDVKEAAETKTDRKIWIHVSLTATGINKLGKKLPSSQDTPDPNQDAFKDGMKSRAGILNDLGINGTEKWVEPFKTNDKKIHGLLIFSSSEKNSVKENLDDLERDISKFGIEILRVEIKEPLATIHGKDKEHFGFRDGVSQPLIEGVSDESKKGQRFPPDHFVLTDQDPWINEGSFMVFRRLEQDVPNFKKFMKETSAKLGMSEDKLGAKFMGRWKSGAPLALDEFQNEDPKRKDLTDVNDFTYMDDDADGKKTPRFSHIRKTNPRGDGVFDTKEENLKANNTHRMLRRGAPYGKEFDENDPASKDVERGLLFMCYVKDIPRQFEFVQEMWANAKNFPKPDNVQGKEIEHGHDPIIGQHNGDGFAQLKLGDSFTRIPENGGFEQWVTMTGGEYFFSPSISALKNL